MSTTAALGATLEERCFYCTVNISMVAEVLSKCVEATLADAQSYYTTNKPTQATKEVMTGDSVPFDCTKSMPTEVGAVVAKQATQVEVRTASREGELSDCTMSTLDGGWWRNRRHKCR